MFGKTNGEPDLRVGAAVPVVMWLDEFELDVCFDFLPPYLEVRLTGL